MFCLQQILLKPEVKKQLAQSNSLSGVTLDENTIKTTSQVRL